MVSQKSDRRQAIREYKDRVHIAGVYQIRNLKTDQLLLGSSLDIQGPLNRHRMQLELNSHPNHQLQADWNGQDSADFSFDILEELIPDEGLHSCDPEELNRIERKWLKALNPVQPKGYNRSDHIREP